MNKPFHDPDAASTDKTDPESTHRAPGASSSVSTAALHAADRQQLLVEYQALLAAALDPVITMDTTGLIRSASNSVQRVFGWLPFELVGRNVSLLMPEPHKSRHDGYLASYRRTGQTNILGRTRQFEAQRRDGTTFPIELSVSRADIPGRDAPLFIGIIRDISERVRSERELRLLQDLALEMAAARDLNAAMAIALQRICEATGWDYGEVLLPTSDDQTLTSAPVSYARSEALVAFAAHSGGARFRRGEGLPGRVWASRCPEWLEDLATDAAFVRKALAKQAELRAGVAIPIPSGDRVVAVMTFLMREARDEDRRQLKIVTAAVAPLGPLVERKLAVDALAENELRTRSMLMRIRLVGVMLDRDGLITFCNQHLLDLTGWREEDLVGRDWFAVMLPPEDRERMREVFREGLERGEIIAHLENRILTRARRTRLIEWSNALIRDSNGRVVGATGLGLDVTERRKLEEELATHRQHLQELVQERTRALQASHEQLRQADRLASIGTLAAGLGHDMNNVLLPVRARLDALEAGTIPASVREQVASIRSSINYLQQLSDGLHLLALAPEDAQASTETTDVHLWWQQVGSLMEKAVPKRVRLEHAVSQDLPLLRVPPHRLTQAVLNLVVNAGEAIPAEGRVVVSASAAANRTSVALSVADSGEGMTPEVRKHALDPFFTTKKRGLGTGLGLSLVQGVVTAAGGSVEIASELGRGTTVTLIIPGVARGATGAAHEEYCRLAATISLSDQRAASFVAALLQAGGWRTRHGDGADGGQGHIWITEPQATSIQAVKRWIRQDHMRRVILFSPRLDEWAGLCSLFVEDASDLEAIRRTIGDALLGLEPPSGPNP